MLSHKNGMNRRKINLVLSNSVIKQWIINYSTCLRQDQKIREWNCIQRWHFVMLSRSNIKGRTLSSSYPHKAFPSWAASYCLCDIYRSVWCGGGGWCRVDLLQIHFSVCQQIVACWQGTCMFCCAITSFPCTQIDLIYLPLPLQAPLSCIDCGSKSKCQAKIHASIQALIWSHHWTKTSALPSEVETVRISSWTHMCQLLCGCFDWFCCHLIQTSLPLNRWRKTNTPTDSLWTKYIHFYYWCKQTKHRWSAG